MTSTTIANGPLRSTATQEPSRSARRVGYALSTLVVLFLLLDAVMKLMAMSIVLTTSAQLGYPGTAEMARSLGILLLICTVLYVIPRTAILGAVLLTAYLGGTVATHLRVGNPLFTHMLFGVYLGVFLWGGLYLRDAALRAVFPWRR
jgi:hypothetical protein